MLTTRILFNVDHIWAMFGPYLGYLWPTLGPCFGSFHHIFAPRCLKWFNFWLRSHAFQTEPYHAMLMLYSIRRIRRPKVSAILASYFVYFYNIFASRCLQQNTFALNSYAFKPEDYSLILKNWDQIGAMFCPNQSHIFGYFSYYFASGCLKCFICLLKCHGLQTEQQHDMSTLYTFRRTMLGQYSGHIWDMYWLFLQYFASGYVEWLKFSLKSHLCHPED